MEAAPFLRNLQQAAADTETEWSFEEIKIFERAIIPEELGFDCDNPFERIAARLPRKTEAQVRIQWQMLVRDIEMIEAGSIPLPHYNTSTKPKRRRGVPWTKEENEYVSFFNIFLLLLLLLSINYALYISLLIYSSFIFFTLASVFFFFFFFKDFPTVFAYQNLQCCIYIYISCMLHYIIIEAG